MPQAFFQVARYIVGVNVVEGVSMEICNDGHTVQMM